MVLSAERPRAGADAVHGGPGAFHLVACGIRRGRAPLPPPESTARDRRAGRVAGLTGPAPGSTFLSAWRSAVIDLPPAGFLVPGAPGRTLHPAKTAGMNPAARSPDIPASRSHFFASGV